MLMRMLFDWDGSPIFKLDGGMGDVIFTPLYRVLEQNGVRFELFHRTTSLHVGSSNTIERIELLRQCHVENPPYDPFITVRGVSVWPNQPKWDLLKDGRALRGLDFESPACTHGEVRVLHKGADFDYVVLGISIGALAPITRELSQRSRPWQAMLERVPTVMTQAAQLWLKDSLADLGCNDPSPLMGAYAPELGTWCDMSHAVRHEDWPRPPRGLHYLCGVLAEDGGDATTRVRGHLEDWLDHEAGHVWPKASAFGNPFGLHPARLHGAASARDGIDAQYWRANAHGSDRYVLTPAGSVKYRLAPDRSGFDNLYLAGDWTKTNINGGCVEAAVESGLKAARAIGSAALRVPSTPRSPPGSRNPSRAKMQT
jgi:uncharacterized protein with NAD-binding domain and iron-sulfur cluster